MTVLWVEHLKYLPQYVNMYEYVFVCMCVFFSLFCVSIFLFTLVSFAIDYLSRVFPTGVLRDSGWLWHWLYLSITVSVPCVSHWCAKGQWLVLGKRWKVKGIRGHLGNDSSRLSLFTRELSDRSDSKSIYRRHTEGYPDDYLPQQKPCPHCLTHSLTHSPTH